MHYLICMAGESKRFRQQGFNLPKFMLTVGNRSMLFRALDSLPILPEDRLLFLISTQQSNFFDIEGFIRREVEKLGIRAKLELMPVSKTRGQLETAFYARDQIDPKAQLAIYNIDTAFTSSTLKARFAGSLPRLDGVLGGFPPDGRLNWSFASTQPKEGELVATQTIEKSPLPGFALTGLYHFSEADSFFSAACEVLKEPIGEMGEYYVAPLYNRLIAKGMEFVVDVVDSVLHMGTPEQLKLAKKKLAQVKTWQKEASLSPLPSERG